MAETIGLTCKMYRNTATWGSPTWVLVDSIIDLGMSSERTKVEASSRASTRKRYLMGLMGDNWSFKFLRDKSDTQQAAFKAAYIAGTAMIVAFADGAIATTGTIYTKVEVFVSKFSDLDEPLEGTATTDCELCLAATSTNEPTDVTV